MFDKSCIVLDLEDDTKFCENLPDIPLSAYGAAGTLINDRTPMYCGGEYEYTTNECYQLDSNGNEAAWIPMSGMSVSLSFPGYATVSSDIGEFKFVIAGGYQETEIEKGFVEALEFYDGNTWRNLTSLPKPIGFACMVAINETSLLFIGGASSEELSNETYFYSIESDDWILGPKLQSPRYSHSCSMVTWQNPSSGNLDRVVVVVGGTDETETFLPQVELLHLDDLASGWSLGPELPEELGVENAVLVEYDSSVILVGGEEIGSFRNHHLYQLKSPEGPWIEMAHKLPYEQEGLVAFLIPDELSNCH